ncbi:rpsE [Symbiodinium necroappetens]|uniref:Small ribosomal subunit protein uS5c n=1 Tax=Symbiodinium necroappetens TaxID=1628268 RepID=A0A812SCD0_9DINO|nr:rpsE [Symbiodinium necroappetens]
MVENVEQGSQLESNTIGIFRSAATVKGGRRFSFGALVVVGDREGRVGVGYAKANEVPPAIEKAQKDGRKAVSSVNLHGGTIPHEVVGRYSASVVKLIPASPGTGVVAGATVRAVLEIAGITDCMTKSYGSNNKKNLAKATLNALETLRTKQDVSRVRGVEIARTEVDEMIERGQAFMTPAAGAKKEAPAEEAKADNGAATATAEKPAKPEKKGGEKKADGEKKQDKDNA